MNSKPGTVTIHPPPYAQDGVDSVEVPLEKTAEGAVMLKALLALVAVGWGLLLYVTVRKHTGLEEPLMAFGWVVFTVGMFFLVLWFLTD